MESESTLRVLLVCLAVQVRQAQETAGEHEANFKASRLMTLGNRLLKLAALCSGAEAPTRAVNKRKLQAATTLQTFSPSSPRTGKAITRAGQRMC